MKATVGKIELEGTPAELKELLGEELSNVQQTDIESTEGTEEEPEGEEGLEEELEDTSVRYTSRRQPAKKRKKKRTRVNKAELKKYDKVYTLVKVGMKFTDAQRKVYGYSGGLKSYKLKVYLKRKAKNEGIEIILSTRKKKVGAKSYVPKEELQTLIKKVGPKSYVPKEELQTLIKKVQTPEEEEVQTPEEEVHIPEGGLNLGTLKANFIEKRATELEHIFMIHRKDAIRKANDEWEIQKTKYQQQSEGVEIIRNPKANKILLDMLKGVVQDKQEFIYNGNSNFFGIDTSSEWHSFLIKIIVHAKEVLRFFDASGSLKIVGAGKTAKIVYYK